MMKENWVYCRGDIYCAKLDPVVGSEQGGIRPVIVIQNDTGNKHAPTLIVATVTTRIHKKANMPTQELLCRGWFLPPNTYDCGSFVVNGTAVVGKE